jgi:hypothetical protein
MATPLATWELGLVLLSLDAVLRAAAAERALLARTQPVPLRNRLWEQPAGAEPVSLPVVVNRDSAGVESAGLCESLADLFVAQPAAQAVLFDASAAQAVARSLASLHSSAGLAREVLQADRQ